MEINIRGDPDNHKNIFLCYLIQGQFYKKSQNRASILPLWNISNYQYQNMLKWTCNAEAVPKKKAWGSWILQTVYTRFLRCVHEKVTFKRAIIMDTLAEKVIAT